MTERWCTGPCGRLLPLSAFASTQRRCHGCHRVAARDRYRKHSKRRGFLARRRERERARYKNDPAYKAAKCASVRRSYWKVRTPKAA